MAAYPGLILKCEPQIPHSQAALRVSACACARERVVPPFPREGTKSEEKKSDDRHGPTDSTIGIWCQ